MASPLAPYINSRVLAVAEGAVSLVNGRYQAAQGDTYLIRCFMKRAQYSGVSSGSKKIPLESQLDGEMMPGASGDQFYYRGYALEYGIVSQTWNPGVDDESLVVFVPVTSQLEVLLPNMEVRFFFGDEKETLSRVQRSTGVFGGQGIDQIIYSEIGGVELQLTAGEVQN